MQSEHSRDVLDGGLDIDLGAADLAGGVDAIVLPEVVGGGEISAFGILHRDEAIRLDPTTLLGASPMLLDVEPARLEVELERSGIARVLLVVDLALVGRLAGEWFRLRLRHGTAFGLVGEDRVGEVKVDVALDGGQLAWRQGHVVGVVVEVLDGPGGKLSAGVHAGWLGRAVVTAGKSEGGGRHQGNGHDVGEHVRGVMES